MYWVDSNFKFKSLHTQDPDRDLPGAYESAGWPRLFHGQTAFRATLSTAI